MRAERNCNKCGRRGKVPARIVSWTCASCNKKIKEGKYDDSDELKYHADYGKDRGKKVLVFFLLVLMICFILMSM